MNFNDLNWHDAIIQNIKIDRNNPGINDAIVFEIKLPEQDGIFELTFEDVYWTKMNLNFGVVAKENILNAVELAKSDNDLTNFYLKWKGMMDNVSLCVYELFLNSSGGNIKIIAKSFEFRKIK